MRSAVVLSLLTAFLIPGVACAQGQQQTPPNPQQLFKRWWDDIMQRLTEMAEDFPEEKYTYRPHPDVRNFAEEFLHIATINQMIAVSHRGERANYGEIAKQFQYTSKADTVAKFKQAVADAAPAIESEDWYKWMRWLEHAGEHYGKLVMHYRNNNLVPPRTRRMQERARQRRQQQQKQEKKD